MNNETINHAVNKNYTEFSKEVLGVLFTKLDNHPIFKKYIDTIRDTREMGSKFAAISGGKDEC